MNEESTIQAPSATGRVLRNVQVGVVEKVSGAKTLRVRLDRLVKEPQYGKYLHRRTRLAVHDETNQARAGDTVEVAPCRPLSKRKAWRLVKIVRRSVTA